MFGRKYIPRSTLFELTLRCNMRCLHCGSSAGTKRIKELSTEEWIRVTRELSDMGGNYITLLGGEPFLRSDWFEISKAINDYGLNLTIISNGLLINEEMISKLRTLDLYSMAISLDGGTSESHDKIRQIKGSFKQCKKVLSMLKDAGINTSVVTTLNKINFEDLPSMRDFLLDKGIAWQVQIAVPIGRFPKSMMLSEKEFYSAALFIATTRKNYGLKRLPVMGAHCFGYNSSYLSNVNIIPFWKGCQAGVSLLGIQSDGGVKGCLSLPDEFIEGNIREKSLSEIWNGPNFCSYNRDFKIQDLGNYCKDCKYGKSCKGGCMSVSTSVTGEKHNDPYCFRLIEESPYFEKISK
jgi:radical SAM protein with 4Fe4S-binding SPASM domain